MKKGFLLFLVLCMLLGLTGCGDSGPTTQGNSGALTADQAKQTLAAYLSRIRTTTAAPRMDLSGTELVDPADELPPLTEYPLSVESRQDITVEIYASTEKAGPGMDGWFNEVAEDFNRLNMRFNGRTGGVSIRPLASGLSLDYLVTGVGKPDAWSPASPLWKDMAASMNVPIEEIVARLAGNTAGILMSPQAHESFLAKYHDMTLENFYNATMAGDLVPGMTNPYASSTAITILSALMQAFDSANPLSAKALKNLEDFQAQSPPVAYTTAQLRDSAAKGVVDAMTMEYQAYINRSELSSFVFTPFGVRHDNPLYAIGGISEEKRAVLKAFADFCLDEASQQKAVRYGFNALEDYAGAPRALTGAQLFGIQSAWKKVKDLARPIAAVFVTDRSGSMDGTPLAELQRSLINASEYITPTNHVGLVSYSTDVSIDLPIAEFNARQKAYFIGAVKSLAAGGNTATYDAVLVGLNMLLEKQKETPNARLMLFVLSDGEQNAGYGLQNVTPIALGLGIPIHTIGYNLPKDGSTKDPARAGLEALSQVNEASFVDAKNTDAVYNLRNIFNAQM